MMADSLIQDYNETSRCMLVELETEIFGSDADEVAKAVAEEALRFRRWFCWHHYSTVEEKFIMAA